MSQNKISISCTHRHGCMHCIEYLFDLGTALISIYSLTAMRIPKIQLKQFLMSLICDSHTRKKDCRLDIETTFLLVSGGSCSWLLPAFVGGV